MSQSDPAVVGAEYRDESRLATRKAAYAGARGPDAREVLFEAIAEGKPRRILELGPGEGELAERVVRELDAEVVAVDQSERMVEITRSRGVDARVGRAEQLEFADASFDCVVAAWMLYHVDPLEQALSEIARVLEAGGRLVAATNGRAHLRELCELIGRERPGSDFSAEDAAQILPAYFATVEARDAHGWLVFPDAEAAQAFVDSLVLLQGARVPPASGPIRVSRLPTVFIATK